MVALLGSRAMAGSPFGAGTFWPDLLQASLWPWLYALFLHFLLWGFCFPVLPGKSQQQCWVLIHRLAPARAALGQGRAPSCPVGLDLHKPLTTAGSSVAGSCLGMAGVEAQTWSVGLRYFGSLQKTQQHFPVSVAARRGCEQESRSWSSLPTGRGR